MATVKEEYSKIQTSGKRPIPGQSLANDPENPAPYEQAPKFTSVHAASEYLWESFIEPATYTSLMETVGSGVPIMDIVQIILFTDFERGLWNPDLMMMLFEPATYMIMALAERQDLDMVIYNGEDDDEMDDELALGSFLTEEKLKRLKKSKESGIVPAGILTSEMESTLETLPEIETDAPVQPSLMGAPQEEEEEQPTGLLARPTGV
jgi:nitroreductase